MDGRVGSDEGRLDELNGRREGEKAFAIHDSVHDHSLSEGTDEGSKNNKNKQLIKRKHERQMERRKREKQWRRRGER